MIGENDSQSESDFRAFTLKPHSIQISALLCWTLIIFTEIGQSDNIFE